MLVASRLSRLREGRGHYGLLALDHGLTFGSGQEVSSQPLANVIHACASDIGGVVVTYGMARSCSDLFGVSLVLQCFGSPLGRSRVQIATVQQALVLDAAAVAIQLNLADPDLSSRTREVAAFVSNAGLTHG
jgi:DhnA family fructose-bisphosphate aldolase class Ia